MKSCTIITDVASVLQQQKIGEQEKDGGVGGGGGSWPPSASIASEDKSSTDELQKSIRLATNVLDLSEDDRCSGCCNYPEEEYGHPRIMFVNGTSKVMRTLQRPNVMNLTGKYFMSKSV